MQFKGVLNRIIQDLPLCDPGLYRLGEAIVEDVDCFELL
jgi:hypothetical protein